MKIKFLSFCFVSIIIQLIVGIEVHAGNIQGVVVDRLTKKPVEGVTVHAKADIDIEEDLKYKSQSAVTNKKGIYLITNLSPDYGYSIYAEKEEYFSAKYSSIKDVYPPKKNKTIILDENIEVLKSVPVAGTVIDEFTEVPIDNAKVILQSEPPHWIEKPTEENKIPDREVFTNGNGVFSFPPLHPDGKYKFIISKPKHSKVTVEYSAEDEDGKVDNPIKIKKFPPPNSVYALVNKKIVPLAMTKNEKIKYTKVQDSNSAGLITGGKFYIKASDLKQIQTFNEGSLDKIIFTTETIEKDYQHKKYIFDPVYFHENFVTVYERNKPSQYLNDKNVFILGSSGILRGSYDFAKRGFKTYSAEGYDQKLFVTTLPNRSLRSQMAQKSKGLKPGIYAITASKYGRYFFEVTNGKSKVVEINDKYNSPRLVQKQTGTAAESVDEGNMQAYPATTHLIKPNESLSQEVTLDSSSETNGIKPVSSEQEKDINLSKLNNSVAVTESNASEEGNDSFKDHNFNLAIQSHLKQLNYYDGTVDGIIGKETTESIIKYQNDEGLTADGNPSLDLLSKLESHTNKKSLLSKGQDNSNSNTVSNKLQSEDYEIKRSAAKFLYAQSNFSDDELDIINDQLLKEYSTKSSGLEIDTLSWYCKILAKSLKEKYIPTLERVSSGGSTFKLRFYASLALSNLKSNSSSNNVSETETKIPESIEVRLLKLKKLRDNNLISEEEYSNRKAEIIDEI